MFTVFAKVAGWAVRPGSVLQATPDIQCTLEDGSQRLLELVALDASHTSRRLTNFQHTQPLWEEALSALPADELNLVRQRFENASLGLHFVREPGQREMREIFPELLKRLLELPQDYQGPLLPHEQCHKWVAWSRLSRGGYHGGPFIVAVSGSGPLKPEWGRIHAKLQRKGYRVGGNFELLAY